MFVGYSMIHVTKAFIGEMLRRRVGVIVNLASIGGVLAIRDRGERVVSGVAYRHYRHYKRSGDFPGPIRE